MEDGDVRKSGESEEKGGKEAREENNRFKPAGRSLEQATLLQIWERKFLGKRKYDLSLDRE